MTAFGVRAEIESHHLGECDVAVWARQDDGDELEVVAPTGLRPGCTCLVVALTAAVERDPS